MARKSDFYAFHCISWHRMVMHGYALYLMVLHSFACHCIVLYGIAWYCIISYGIAWYCIVWLRRAGCISQDTYLLYIRSILQKIVTQSNMDTCLSFGTKCNKDIIKNQRNHLIACPVAVLCTHGISFSSAIVFLKWWNISIEPFSHFPW